VPEILAMAKPAAAAAAAAAAAPLFLQAAIITVAAAEAPSQHPLNQTPEWMPS
jgi:hypothetical protein